MLSPAEKSRAGDDYSCRTTTNVAAAAQPGYIAVASPA